VGALADIIRRHAPAYVQQFGDRMPTDHRRVLRDVARCRTAEAGGQLWHCTQCGHEHTAAHSCGNRHCPTCGGDDARAWLNRQLDLRLPVSYFLVTPTVPQVLRCVIRSHPRTLLPLLFHSSSSTLLDLCRNPEWFGATPGITGMLHTWARNQIYHPHIHYLVTGGGIDPTGAWRKPAHGFLVPGHALSKVFRARFMAGLKHHHPDIAATLPASIWKTDWVVHVKHVGNGENTLKYLARYIYRVGLTDSSILHHDDKTVTFRYRESDTGRSRKITLPVMDFLARFLQHVLPKGFVKVRYYGLHHPAHREALGLVRAQLHLLLGLALAVKTPSPPKPVPMCPVCHAALVPGLRFRAGARPPTTGPPQKTAC